jgi:hypothetical protein
MTQIQDFKDNAYQTVWDHAKSIFKPFLILGVIGYATIFLLSLILSTIIGPSFIDEYSGAVSGNDYEAQIETMRGLLEGLQNVPFFAIKLFTMMLVGTLISAWIMNIRLIVSQNVLLEKSESVISAIIRSFNKKVWLIFGSYLLVIALFVLLGIATSLVGVVGSIALVIYFWLFAMVLLIRFLGSASAIVHGDLSVLDSIKFSFKHITFGRALIIFAILIGGAIIIVIATLLTAAIFGMFGGVGAILNLIVSFVLGVLANAMLTSVQSGIFFRYADVEIASDEARPEDHLVE